MNHTRWRRLAGVLAAIALGLGLLLLGWRGVQAQGGPAPASGQTWFVRNNPGDGLVGYWKFDQVSDGSTLNSVFLSDPTALVNGASITKTQPPSVTLPNFGAVALDGINDSVVVTDVAPLDVPDTSFSVAAWVKRVYTGTHTADLIYDSSTASGHWFFGFLANNRLALTTNDLSDYFSTLTVSDSNWHHVAATVNAGSLVLYLDGVASAPIGVVITASATGNKRIGNKNGLLNTPFGGVLDEVRLYKRPLSAAEVGRLAAGRGCVTDGTSWATAFQDLQCGLGASHNGDQIWIANGTYRPGTDHFATFSPVNNTQLLGGFTGSETSPAQRPPFNTHSVPTALSGDLAGNDRTLSFGNYFENACNVVRVGSLAFPGAPSVSFDELAIQAGNAEAGNACAFPAAARGGGMLVVGASSVSLSDVVFRFNRASDAGGGLAADIGHITLQGGLFFSNTADGPGFPLGGGLAAQGAQITITASSFVSNTAFQGGAIDLRPTGSQASLTVSDTDFTTNLAKDGGAIEDQVTPGVLDIVLDGDTFTGNRSTGADGGAIENSGFSGGLVRTQLQHTTFTGNTSAEDGGAIADTGEQLTVDDSHFSGNHGATNGGALDIQGVVTITNSSFVSNTSKAVGGALAVFGNLSLADSSFTQNRVDNPGLALDFEPIGGGGYVDGGAAITDTQFFSNTAVVTGTFSNLAQGGGLAVVGNLTLSGGDLRNNSARQGGGLYVQGSASVQHGLFQTNRAGEGGALFADGDLVLLSSRLIDNTALLADATNQPGRGGALFLQNGNFGNQISNNLFLGNQALSVNAEAPRGAAMLLGAATILVSNNTIVSHDLITTSAISLVTGTAFVGNSIITSHSVALDNQGGFNLFEDYNLFDGNTVVATGVISALGHSRQADPRFVAAGLDNFQLQLSSPGIDAGENDRVPLAVTTDLAGGPRFVDIPSVPDTGAGTAPIVDIGAFEVNDRLFLPLAMKN